MVAQMKRTGVTPPRLARKPHLSWHMNQYLTAYLNLDRRRQTGYAMAQPLSIEAIIQYGERFGFVYDMEFFMQCMSRLDDDYLKEQAERLKRAHSKNKAKKGR